MNKQHKFILIANDQAIIEFGGLNTYTPEEARKLSQKVSELLKTKSNIILSPEFEFVDRRIDSGLEKRVRSLEKRVRREARETA